MAKSNLNAQRLGAKWQEFWKIVGLVDQKLPFTGGDSVNGTVV